MNIVLASGMLLIGYARLREIEKKHRTVSKTQHITTQSTNHGDYSINIKLR